MTNKQSYEKSLGFTLIELLIALFIFVIVAAVASSALYSIVELYGRFNQHMQWLRHNQISIGFVQKDMRNMVGFPVYDNNGKLLPPLAATPTSISFSALQPLANADEALVRIVYLWNRGQLIREVFSVNNWTIQGQIDQEELWNNLNGIQVRYLSYGQGFTENWPPGGLTTQLNQNTSVIPLPRAVAFDLSFLKEGELNLLIPIPTSNLPPQHSP